MRLQGKIAVVTGAGTGIGHGIALAMAREGADIAIHYHGNAQGAESARQAIESAGRHCLVKQANLGVSAEARGFIDTALERYGRIDILVNNSGVTWPEPFLELKEETWDQTFAINLKSMYLCSQQTARAMVAQGTGGRIINLTSVHGFASTPRHAHYEATKGGINMFTKGLAVELAPHGITVNAIAPGAIEVERYFTPDYDRDTLGKQLPLGRVGVPEDIAGAAVFLASDEASYVTGAILLVDGGLIARMALSLNDE